jgi:hypothetical protein
VGHQECIASGDLVTASTGRQHASTVDSDRDGETSLHLHHLGLRGDPMQAEVRVSRGGQR